MPAPTLAALALLPLTALTAQVPSPWHELVFPGGVNQNQAISLGKLNVYHESTNLNVYSAVTRRWHATTASIGAALFLTNDCLLVQDGTTWTAFAANRGVFAPLAVSPQAQLLNAANQTNDEILAVRDGNQLHTFTGFVGAWSTRLVSPTAGVATKRNVLLLADGITVAGMDAYTGQWHDLPVAGSPTLLDADGAAGIAIVPPLVHAFSANHATWQSATLPTGAVLDRDDDWVLLHTPAEMLAYSGQQARFEHAPLGALSVRASEDHFALVETMLGIVPYSAIRGSFGPLLGQAGATVTTSTSVALVSENGVSTAYSAARNVAAALAADASLESAAGVVAVTQAAGGNGWRAFSALTGQWHAAPNDVLGNAPMLTTTGAMFDTTTGIAAFSAVTGAFERLAGAGITMLANPSSAIAAAWDATHLHAFDVRTGRWRSVARSGGPIPPVVQVWRTTLQATDGQLAYGFGTASGEWATTPLPEAFATGRANSESGRLITNTRLLGYSSLGEIVGWPQFPGFRRVLTAGATARLSLPLAGGDLAVVAFGWRGAPTPIAGFGELLLEPTTMVSLFMLPTPGEPVRQFALPVPAHPLLVGVDLAVQPLLLRAAAAPYLGDATVLSVW